jgi:hypothetical protein
MAEIDSSFGECRLKMTLESPLIQVIMQSPVTVNHQHLENNTQVSNAFPDIDAGNTK